MRSKLWFITILPLKTDRSLNKTTNYSLFLHESGFFGLFSRQCWNLTLFFFSCPHSSLQVRSVQTQSHCCSVTDGSDAILFSRLSEWRGWRRQLSSGSVLSHTRAGDISASLFGLVVGNIRYAQMGKRGESSISDSNIVSFRLWSGANSGILSAPWNNMWQSTHTQAQHVQTIWKIQYSWQQRSMEHSQSERGQMAGFSHRKMCDIDVKPFIYPTGIPWFWNSWIKNVDLWDLIFAQNCLVF